MTIDLLFYELIRVAIGTQESPSTGLRAGLSRLPSHSTGSGLTPAEWEELFEMAVKQSLVGVCFCGIHRLGADSDEGYINIGMSEDLYFDWMGTAAQINIKNELMDNNTKAILAHFRKEGFACTALKDQGIAKLYGSLCGFRQSGDVDVWVAGGRKKLYDHSMKMFGKLEGLTYHHIHNPLYDDPEVEAHVWPSFLSSPLRNRRLQQFCRMNEPKDGCEDVPSLAFNRVFILLHCYQHFTRRGVGMRQLLDYYFVLLQGFSEEEKTESMKWITALGMKRFAGAMMWMMKDVFGLDKKSLLCESDETYGRFLLDEVMQTGNMGHADERVDKKQLQSAARALSEQLETGYQDSEDLSS